MLLKTLQRTSSFPSVISHGPLSGISMSASTPPSRRETRRGRYIMKRRWFLPHIPNLEDVNKYPYDEHERGDFHVYDIVEETHNNPPPDMRVILTKYVEGFGDIGDVITVPANDARNYLIPARLALYDTSENKAKMALVEKELNLTDRIQRTPFAALTARQLEERLTLPIVMNPHVPWKLDRFHVVVALRGVGVMVESEDCVTLPEEEVTEPRDIVILVTVNGIDNVRVKARVIHWYINLEGKRVHKPFEIWAKPKEKPKEWMIDSAEPVRKL